MADSVYFIPPAINAPLYTTATLPAPSDCKQQFIQVSDVSGVGAGLMYSDGATWRTIAFTAQRIRVQTATDGTYTWTYPTPFAAGTIPKLFVVAEGGAGVTDVINAQTDGPPTATQCKIRVTRSPLTSIALLGLTLAVPVSGTAVGAVWVSIIALQ